MVFVPAGFKNFCPVFVESGSCEVAKSESWKVEELETVNGEPDTSTGYRIPKNQINKLATCLPNAVRQDQHINKLAN